MNPSRPNKFLLPYVFTTVLVLLMGGGLSTFLWLGTNDAVGTGEATLTASPELDTRKLALVILIVTIVVALTPLLVAAWGAKRTPGRIL